MKQIVLSWQQYLNLLKNGKITVIFKNKLYELNSNGIGYSYRKISKNPLKPKKFKTCDITFEHAGDRE